METFEFTTKHIAKYRLSFATNYLFSTDKLCFNQKSGKVVKQVMKGSTIGYIINGKFRSLDFLIRNLERIPKEDCPF